MRAITHHPSDDLLLGYAAGSAVEAAALVVATHLSLCPRCRKIVSDAEAAGGVFVEQSEPVSLDAGAFQSVLNRLDDPTGLPSTLRAPQKSASGIPMPLREYIGADFDKVEWKKITGGLSFKSIFKSKGANSVLIRTKPGCGVYEHTHRGEELTLVLTGGFTDQTGHYRRGDFQSTSPEIHHSLIADVGEDCIVLAMTDAPVKFRNPLVGLLAGWFGF